MHQLFNEANPKAYIFFVSDQKKNIHYMMKIKTGKTWQGYRLGEIIKNSDLKDHIS